jgi:hypothetical protein
LRLIASGGVRVMQDPLLRLGARNVREEQPSHRSATRFPN